jgi:hypothetical protein
MNRHAIRVFISMLGAAMAADAQDLGQSLTVEQVVQATERDLRGREEGLEPVRVRASAQSPIQWEQRVVRKEVVGAIGIDRLAHKPAKATRKLFERGRKLAHAGQHREAVVLL